MLVILIRTVILYLVVIGSIRLMGKRQIGELQPSELVVTLMISELAAIPMQDSQSPILSGVVAIFTLVVLEIVLSVILLKWRAARRLIAGKPAVIIRDGVVDQRAMRDLRISVDDLAEDLRQAGYFRLQDVAWAILETNGKLSVLPYAGTQPPSREDMKIPSPDPGLPITLISDGKAEKDTDGIEGTSREDRRRELAAQKLMTSDVFWMIRDKQGFLIIAKDRSKKGRKGKQ